MPKYSVALCYCHCTLVETVESDQNRNQIAISEQRSRNDIQIEVKKPSPSRIVRRHHHIRSSTSKSRIKHSISRPHTSYNIETLTSSGNQKRSENQEVIVEARVIKRGRTGGQEGENTMYGRQEWGRGLMKQNKTKKRNATRKRETERILVL
jgi:hypothetical protein